MTPKVFRCRICRVRLPEALYVIRNGEVMVSGRHAYHYHDTHGIPPEILVDMANDHMERVRDGLAVGPIEATVLE